MESDCGVCLFLLVLIERLVESCENDDAAGEDVRTDNTPLAGHGIDSSRAAIEIDVFVFRVALHRLQACIVVWGEADDEHPARDGKPAFPAAGGARGPRTCARGALALAAGAARADDLGLVLLAGLDVEAAGEADDAAGGDVAAPVGADLELGLDGGGRRWSVAASTLGGFV